MPLAQGPRDRAGYRDPPASRLGRWEHGGKSEWAARARPVPVVPRLTGRPRPTCRCAPRRGRNRLPGVRCAPRAPAPVIQVEPWAQRAKFCCGFSLPASPPAPAPRASAGRRPLPTQAQGPAGRGEGGRACAHGAGLGEDPTSRELAPPPGPLSAPAADHAPNTRCFQRTTSACQPTGWNRIQSGPPHLRRAEKTSSIQFLGASSSLRRFCNLSRRKYLSCSLSHPRVLSCGKHGVSQDPGKIPRSPPHHPPSLHWPWAHNLMNLEGE